MKGSRARAYLAVLALIVVGAGALLWFSAGVPTSDGQPRRALTRPKGSSLSAAGADQTMPGGLGGRVIAPDGAGVAGATVVVTRQRRDDDPAGASSLSRIVKTAADGTFAISGLVPGIYAATAVSTEFMGASRFGIQVAPGAHLLWIELRLAGGGVLLSGQLLDAGGGPLPGARLRARALYVPSDATTVALELEVEADDRGRYALRLHPAPYRLTASADGYVPAHDRVEMQGPLSRDFKLQPAARITGRVVIGYSKLPLSGATVSAHPRDRTSGEPRYLARTDGEGKFVFLDVPGGSYQLTATSGKMIGHAAQPVVVGSAGAVEGVEIAVEEGLTLEGIVRSAKGEPVHHASVSLVGGRDPGRYFVARTDEAGRYTVVGLHPGTFVVRFGSTFGPWKSERIAITASATRDFVLDEPARVTGLVLSMDGRPAIGAKVQAFTRHDSGRTAGSSGGGSAETDSDGQFTLEDLPAGELTLAFSLRDQAARVEGERLGAGESKRLTVRLHAAGSVSGVVTWDDGSPAENATVWARSPGTNFGRRQTVTNKSGIFEIGDLIPGELSVVARASTDGTADPPEPGPERASVTLRAGERKTGVKLVLAKRTETISGVVLDEQGEPAAGASVLARVEHADGRSWRSTAGCGNGLTGADGTFIVEGLRKGSYTVWASDAQHADVERARVPTGSRDVRLRFTRGGTLSGSVLGADGRPVRQYSLLLLRPGGAGGDVGLRQAVDRTPPLVVRDPGGAFRIDQVAAGTYDLVAVAPDGRVARASVAVSAGENKRGLRLTASPGVDVHGTVVDQESGQPLPGVEVLVAVPADQSRGATTTAQGTFRISDVPAVPGLSVHFSPDRSTHVPDRRTLGAPRDGRVDLGTITLSRIDPNRMQR